MGNAAAATFAPCARPNEGARLSAPFPWFGGKSGAAPLIWERFGNVPNYVDPFCGSLAVPLLRPHPPKIETVNDADGLLVNFWRAVAADPDEVARWADWPVSEADLHPRHAWLVARRHELAGRLMGDPEHHDAKMAGWWAWGQCAWIGRGWGRHLWRQLPRLGDAGGGLHRPNCDSERWLRQLRDRTRGMRITCGDWRRVLNPVVTWRHGITGILLDPPYAEGAAEYSGGNAVAAEVGEWARENGDDQRLRIALCGHEGDHDMPGWDCVGWKARGGYGNQGGEDAEDNRHRETIWFSPGCLNSRQGSLF